MLPTEPVSGNPIPPGALPQEVKDDIPAKLSEGEFIIPANVVRYYGLKFFNNLMDKAKSELGDDLPFSDDELETDEPRKMAQGGFVPAQGGFTPTPGVEVDPVVPLFNRPAQMPQDNNESWLDKYGRDGREGPTGLAGSVDNWSVQNFADYARSADSFVNRGIAAGIASIIPMGGRLMNHRYNYLNETVPTRLREMIESGKNQKGETISQEDMDRLKQAEKEILERGEITPGVRGLVQKGMDSLFGKREEPTTPAARQEEERPQERSEERSTSNAGGVKDSQGDGQMKSQTSSTPGTDKTGTATRK